MLTHVHKGIHLVVGIFEQGLEISPMSCTEKTGFHRVDRTLALTGPVRLVGRDSEDAGVDLRPDVGVVHPVLLTWQRTEKRVTDRMLSESDRA